MEVQGSKNNRTRRFRCSDRLCALLQRIRPESPNPDDTVFRPIRGGKWINYRHFCQVWDKVVDPIKPGTTPYSCRDTFITTQIAKGIPETVVVQWVDSSVGVIEKTYTDFLKMSSLRPVD